MNWQSGLSLTYLRDVLFVVGGSIEKQHGIIHAKLISAQVVEFLQGLYYKLQQ